MRHKISIRFLFVFAVFLAFSVVSNAQLSASNPLVMQRVATELQKRGLTEAEVRYRLMQDGINIDALTPADAPKYQSQIMATLDKMTAEKKAQRAGNNATDSLAAPLYKTTNKNTDSLRLKMPQPIKKPVVAKADSSGIYGHSLFSNNSFEAYTTTDGAQAPDTYVLGEGDEIHITIFGASQTDIQQRISSEGAIQPAGVARIFLKGLTLAQAREVVKRQLASAYLFREDQIALTVVKVRTILVNVFGEVKSARGFSLSAMNSALNALTMAGGPTKIGSVRNIQLIRGNNRRNIDLYAYINNPAAKQNFDLQNNDVIYVPVSQKIVTIEGAVNRPMKYELLPSENIQDLIQFAGGLSKNASVEDVQIKRYENGEQLIISVSMKDVAAGKKLALSDGDIVYFKSINKPMQAYVEIQGSVYYPGKYDLKANATLAALIATAKPTFQAKTDMVYIERLRPDSTVEIISNPFPAAGSPDFVLEGRDVVRVMDQTVFRDIATISVTGEVRQPFSRKFGMNDRISVKSALELAGGLRTSVFPVAYIFRKNLLNPVKMQYIAVDLENCDEVMLQAGDQLNVYDNSTYSNIGEIRISGAVKHVKSFTFDSSMTLKDLITNAGGFALGAAYNRVEIFRNEIFPDKRPKLTMITLTVDTAYNLVAPAGFSLRPFDKVVIRMVPEFTTGRTVEINGEVSYPGPYVLESRKVRLTDVIKMAGGLLNTYDPNGTILFRTYNKRGEISFNMRKAMEHPNNLSYNPIVFDGDVINVQPMENTVSIISRGTRMAQYSNKLHNEYYSDSLYYESLKIDSLSIQQNNQVFQGAKNAGWYIRNFAGGFMKNADRNSVTVTYANNQMQATRRFLFFRCYPTVVPGSTISLQMKPPKEKSEEKKFDFDAAVSKMLNVSTAMLSLFVLSKTLKN